MADLIRVTIDGKETLVKPDMTILQAATDLGIDIPAAINYAVSELVTLRYVDPGCSVEAGDPLVRVTALSPIRLEALLPESMLASFSGPTVVSVSTSFPDTTIDVLVDLGTIVVDPSSGTFPLQIEMDNAEGRLVPGVSCVVAIPDSPKGSQ